LHAVQLRLTGHHKKDRTVESCKVHFTFIGHRTAANYELVISEKNYIVRHNTGAMYGTWNQNDLTSHYTALQHNINYVFALTNCNEF